MQADIQQLMQDQQAAALRNQELARYTAKHSGSAPKTKAISARASQHSTPVVERRYRGSCGNDCQAIGTGPDTNVPLRAGTAAPVGTKVTKQPSTRLTSIRARVAFAAIGGYGDMTSGFGYDLSTTARAQDYE